MRELLIWVVFACTYRCDVPIVPKIWPIPASAVYAESKCSLSSDFRFETAVYEKPTMFETILFEGVSRANADIKKLMRFTSLHPLSCELQFCSVVVSESHNVWEETKDSEWYKIGFDGHNCLIECKSVRGCLHGLTTFTQLVDPLVLNHVPSRIEIEDAPKFVYRSVMIDTGRRFLPIDLIKRHIDVMHSVKMNVLHWHIVDDHSFPLEVVSLPLLSGKGAYSPKAVYTHGDVRSIVEYAANRGIRVIPELDVPGHTESWMKGYPELLGKAKSGIDPTRLDNWDFLEILLQEVSILFASPWYGDRIKIHLGGDETWDGWDTPAISLWMREHGMKGKGDLVFYWLKKLLDLTRKLRLDVILWEDFLADLNGKSVDDVIWELWQNKDSVGTSILATPFYLDHLEKDWADYYDYKMNEKFFGGETCMWGEWVDASNFMSRVWPRAAAVAERLWSNPDEGAFFATSRLAKWTCRQRHWFGFLDVGNVGQIRSEEPDELWTWHTDKEQWFCRESTFDELAVVTLM